MAEGLKDAALVLVGHGSARNPDSSRPTRAHAETIRGQGIFAEVHVAFWKEAPFLRDVIEGVSAKRVFVVPNLACKGWVTSDVIPREMGLDGPLTRKDDREIHYCDPVGQHPRIAEIVAKRVGSVMPEKGSTSVLLVGHGSGRSAQSSIRTNEVAAALAALGLDAEVKTAFLEQEPRLEDWTDITPAANLIVVPFMISNGLHGAEDVPRILGIDPAAPELARMAETGTPAGPFAIRGRKIWYCLAVGSEKAIAEIVIDMARAAAG